MSGMASGGGAVSGAPSGLRPRDAGLVTGALERWTLCAGWAEAGLVDGSAGVPVAPGASAVGPDCAAMDGVTEGAGAGVDALGAASEVTGAPRPARGALREALRCTAGRWGFTGDGVVVELGV
ncbi:hypothetical protein ACFQ7F_35485 [Streptomyces sp. NPDC056486]|uniref:hypothetical protein n=1 Tax=Streptomyces sp. NPDC056486 TaxID=3345835 RepID=UPI0036C7F9AC